MIDPKNGSVSSWVFGSGTTRATDPVRRVASERATGLGVKPSSAMAASTAALVAGLTR